jgi:YgiT-type zinc finger domain-containing protein
MRKTTARETLPIKGGTAAFDAACWKCPACGEEAYDEKQYARLAARVQNTIKPISRAIIQRAQEFEVAIELHFTKSPQKAVLTSKSTA